MPNKNQGGIMFDSAIFRQSSSLFDPSTTRLPQEALHNMAREVVARMSHRAKKGTSHVSDMATNDQIEMLVDAFVSNNPERAAEMVLELQAGGVSIEDIYLRYLSTVAIHLGERWEDDRLSFVQVSLAAGRMLGILRGLRMAFIPNKVSATRRAIFASVPSNDHVIGVSMAADLFRRKGWDIDLLVGLKHDELVEKLDHCDSPIIGLSAGSIGLLEPLARLIVAIRVSNPGVLILVSGHIVAAEPDIAQIVDADAVAHDAISAEREMERLIALSMQHSTH